MGTRQITIVEVGCLNLKTGTRTYKMSNGSTYETSERLALGATLTVEAR